MSSRVAVGVLGATGMVGQQFVRLLAGIRGSRSPGWPPASVRKARRTPTPPPGGWPPRCPTLLQRASCSGPSRQRPEARVLRARRRRSPARSRSAFAEAGHIVVSNSRNYRMDPLVPLLIPEVNAGPPAAARRAEARRRLEGRASSPTRTARPSFLAMALAPLRPVRPDHVRWSSTLQAVSGAGYPGVPSLDILGNVIPFIGGEEEKIETETAEDSRQPRRRTASSHTR